MAITNEDRVAHAINKFLPTIQGKIDAGEKVTIDPTKVRQIIMAELDRPEADYKNDAYKKLSDIELKALGLK